MGECTLLQVVADFFTKAEELVDFEDQGPRLRVCPSQSMSVYRLGEFLEDGVDNASGKVRFGKRCKWQCCRP
jgi:hypothetical protein